MICELYVGEGTAYKDISMCAVSEILLFCARFEDRISVTVDITVMEWTVVSKYDVRLKSQYLSATWMSQKDNKLNFL
jgi:hypothetical protein